jgi:CheY-like chemotaxis protein
MSVVTARPLQEVDGVCGCRILVAEDDATSQDIALLMLDRLGYHADVASDGVEAVSAFQIAFYDVVLMDVRMPRMDGMEAARQIRADLDPAEQPTIIAMSADTTSQCREDCFRAGMDQHLAKPLRLEPRSSTLEYSMHSSPTWAATRTCEPTLLNPSFSTPRRAPRPLSPLARRLTSMGWCFRLTH